MLNSLRESGLWVPVTFNFSAQTTSKRIQDIIELKFEKRKRTLLTPPIGKRVCVFVDDVNMPRLDTYGSQPPIELLRQVLDFGGFYDRNKLFWKTIEDMVLTTACAPPGGGRNPLSPRFMRHFGMLVIPMPTDASLRAIFKCDFVLIEYIKIKKKRQKSLNIFYYVFFFILDLLYMDFWLSMNFLKVCQRSGIK